MLYMPLIWSDNTRTAELSGGLWKYAQLAGLNYWNIFECECMNV